MIENILIKPNLIKTEGMLKRYLDDQSYHINYLASFKTAKLKKKLKNKKTSEEDKKLISDEIIQIEVDKEAAIKELNASYEVNLARILKDGHIEAIKLSDGEYQGKKFEIKNLKQNTLISHNS